MKLELLKPHSHAGKAYAPGAVITLDDDLADWLVDTGVARVHPIQQAPKPKSLSPTEEPSK